MRKRYHSDPRFSRPLGLEIFEDRCLFSVANSLLAPAFLSPRLLEPPTLPTPALTRVVVPTDTLLGVTARTGADMPNGAGAPGSQGSGHIAVALNPSGLTSVVGTTSASLTGGIAGTLSELIGIISTTNLQVSLGVQVSPVGIVGISTVVAASVGAGDAGTAQLNVGIGSNVLPGLSIRPVDGVSVTVGGTTSPAVGVKLNAELVHGDSLNGVIRVDVGASGPQEAPPPGNPTTDLVGAYLTLDREAGPNGLGGGNIVVASEGVGTGFNANTSARAQVAAPTPERNPDTEIPLQSGDEPRKDAIPEPAGSDAALEPNLQNSQRIALLPWSTSLLVRVPDDLAGETQARRPDGIDSPAAAGPATVQSGTSEVGADAPLPPPRHEGLTDSLSFDLALLEGDIQAFLQQIEQLGGELSSLLARMNLSPWLMAIAVAAVAGEIARLRLQGPHRRPQLAACEGETLAWFPGLTGPWSPKEP
jgi:hypothetical protein